MSTAGAVAGDRLIRKRPHRKVRSGCIECKTRKIKCDELKPQCSHCKRYGTTCIYPTLPLHPASSALSRSVKPSSAIPLSPDIPKDLSEGSTDLHVEDLELLHHWTMFAHTGFGDKPEDRLPWQVEMPQIACKQPFLMRGILAVSALHMSRARPEQKQRYLMRAVYHQNLALPSYRYVIADFRNNMTEENCHAVIGFASLTSAYAFADPHPLGTNRFAGVSSTTGVPEWLHLLRGARQILDVGRDWIAKGPMAFQLRSSNEKIDLSYNPDDYLLAELEVLFHPPDSIHSLSKEEVAAYTITLKLLRECSAIPNQPIHTLGVKLSMFRWVEMVPQMYLELLGELKPEALILLAHFCILLKKGGAHYWYMEGAAERLICALRDVLDDKWRPWIAWPLRVVNDEVS